MSVNADEARGLLANLYCCRQYAVLNGQQARNLAQYVYGVRDDRDAWRSVAMAHEAELREYDQRAQDAAMQVGMVLAMIREGEAG